MLLMLKCTKRRQNTCWEVSLSFKARYASLAKAMHRTALDVGTTLDTRIRATITDYI